MFKTIILVLALAVAVLAQAKSDVKNKGEGHVNGSVNWDFFSDNNFKGKLEGIIKPFAEMLKGRGVNGDVKSENEGKTGGHITGNIKFSGKRGAKVSSLQGLNSESSQGSIKIPSEIISLLPSANSNQASAKVIIPVRQ